MKANARSGGFAGREVHDYTAADMAAATALMRAKPVSFMVSVLH